ncbi:MAG: hypothetical protein ACRCS8_04750 [Brevinema sp.]
MKSKHLYFSLLFSVLLISVDLHSQVFSWHHKNLSSLKVLSKTDIVQSNCSFMATSDGAMFITEDTVLQDTQTFNKIFARFTKTLLSSHVIVSLINSYTDQEIQSWTFYENGSFSMDELPLLSDRIYFKITIFGEDLQLRTAGLTLKESSIASEKDLKVSNPSLHTDTDFLTLDLALKQEAKVYLYVYDKSGSIVQKISDGQILNKGSYQYHWDPAISLGFDSGEYYYIWTKLENLRSETVEFTKNIYVMPKDR